MPRSRSLKVTYAIVLVALSSSAVAACGGGGGTKADSSKAQAAGSGYTTTPTDSRALSIGTGVHVTNAPTKAFRVKPVDTTESVAVGPTGYPVYTFQGETTDHVVCQKTAIAKTNCWAFWPPVSLADIAYGERLAYCGFQAVDVRQPGLRQLAHRATGAGSFGCGASGVTVMRIQSYSGRA